MDARRTKRLRPMTRQQRRVLAFCDYFLTQNDQLPTMQAITDHFDWSSTNSAFSVLVSLERRGMIERNALGKFRFTEAGRTAVAECAEEIQ
jgi:SOS-response transcriptional repressor LexA